MAEEPQPPTVTEGADAPDALPANAEDRKAAKAMSSLDGEASAEQQSGPKKEVDLKALNDAMKHLGGLSYGAEKKKESGPLAGEGKKEAPKPLVKVDAGDVALMAEQLDMSKIKAAELLRAHDADVIKTMTAWVTAAV